MARVPVPEEASIKRALLVRVWPAPKLTSELMGACALPGKKLILPAWAAPTTVMLTATALAVAGMPQGPETAMTRWLPGGMAGPPPGPLGFRVSNSRQGATV